MSSNRFRRAARSLLIVSFAAIVSACATDGVGTKTAKTPPSLPTEQFSINVSEHEDQIMLAPHAVALSGAQASALSDLVIRWRDTGDGEVRIQTPSRGGEDAYRASSLVQDALLSLGVGPDRIKVMDYDPGARPNAPIVVGFTRYEAKGPVCGKKVNSFTHTANNAVNSNFGCANTANIAAMVADPHDFIAPRDEAPADAARRSVVLGKWRAGQVTSSMKDAQASGTVSAIGQ